METIMLNMEVSDVKNMQSKEIEPTFEIRNNGKNYKCDPIPATTKSKLVFEAYEKTKLTGYFDLKFNDEKELLPSIIDFLHGGTLIIDTGNAKHMHELAMELGIPLIVEYSSYIVSQMPSDCESVS